MTMLMDLRENIRSFYQKNAGYINPILKIVFSFFILFFLSIMFKYNARINHPWIFLLIALAQAVLPISVLYFFAAVLIAANLWVVSPEVMMIFAAVAIACWLLFVRFNKKYTILILLTPVLFFLKLEYLLPVLAGMIAGLGGLLPVAGGVLIYYISVHMKDISLLLTSDSGNATGQAAQQMIRMINADKTFFVMIVTFSTVILISAVLYRMFSEKAWMLTVFAGNIALGLILLSGRMIFDLDYAIWRLILECVLAAFLAVVYQLFKGIGDIGRIEKISFEDDEYIYYVKAVPRIKVTMTDWSMTRIEPEDSDLEEESDLDDSLMDELEDGGSLEEQEEED